MRRSLASNQMTLLVAASCRWKLRLESQSCLKSDDSLGNLGLDGYQLKGRSLASNQMTLLAALGGGWGLQGSVAVLPQIR